MKSEGRAPRAACQPGGAPSGEAWLARGARCFRQREVTRTPQLCPAEPHQPLQAPCTLDLFLAFP